MTNDVQKENLKETDETLSVEDAEQNVEKTQNVEKADTVDEALASLKVNLVSELETELKNAKAVIEEQKEIVLRAKAEADNARRRAQAEVEKAKKFALERFAKDLLPVIDNLERALLSSDPENESVKPVLEGVELTHKSFISTVEKFGMLVIDPQGEPFNPDCHQAISMQESSDTEPNTILSVMQKGYQLNGRLVRPAMVVVSRAVESGVDTQV